MTMRIQFLSDIHLERRKPPVFDFPATAPYLALCGDIGDPGDKSYKEFLFLQANRFDKVFVIAGNHETFHHKYDKTIDMLRQVCALRDNLVFLNNEVADLEDVLVAGTTLWSCIDARHEDCIRRTLNDFRFIKNWSVTQHNRKHGEAVDFLRDATTFARNEGKRLVVLCHHAPTHSGTSGPEYEDSFINSAFATELKHMITAPIAVVIHGHTHFSNTQIVNGVQLMSNQVGYEDEASTGYTPGLFVEL